MVSGTGNRKRIPLETKIVLAKRLLAGESAKELEREFQVSNSMIYKYKNDLPDMERELAAREAGARSNGHAAPASILSIAPSAQGAPVNEMFERMLPMIRAHIRSADPLELFQWVSMAPTGR